MTKILRVITRMNVGGPARQVAFLHEAILKKRGVDSILVYGSLDKGEGDFSNLISGIEKTLYLKPLVRPVYLWQDFKAFTQLYLIIKKEKIDILHTHTAKAGLLARLAAVTNNMGRKLSRKKPIVIIHTYHGHVFDGYFSKTKTFLIKKIESFLWSNTNTVITLTEGQSKEICTHLQKDPSKCKIVPLGLDLYPFTTISKTKYFNDFFNQDATHWVGWVGRLSSIKNPKRFLEISAELCKHPSLNHVNFVLVGNGELIGQLKASITQLALEKRIFLHGWANDLNDIYSGLDMFFNTSDNEGTPVAVLEAIASGVPVAATDVGGTSEILHNIENSWVFEKDNWLESINAWSDFLQTPKPISQNTRLKIAQRFSRENLLSKLESLYQI